ENLGPVFDGISSVMVNLINVVLTLLTAPHALVVTGVFTLLALCTRKVGFAVFTLGAFLLIQGMDLWVPAMESLAIVIVASVVAVGIGVPIGIWAARSSRVSSAVRPVLDFMQTLPVFVYLLPAVFFFGVGVVPGVVSTTVFAIPPAVRLTELGIRQVDKEVVEAALAFGARPRQMLRDVQFPMAMPSIMAGVNQVIMLALSMVVIAGMVGAGGLGTIVVRGISTLDMGDAAEGGIAVVIIAIFLDRLTSAFAAPRRGRGRLRAALATRRNQAAPPATATAAAAAASGKTAASGDESAHPAALSSSS
ncbi:ABC transporter permease, partial [Streptomyces sp. NPDC002845]